MTDSVRERIANAIRAGIYRAGDDATDDQTWIECADAVIAELGLWQQWSNWHEGHYRYVTDWSRQ